MSAERTPVKVFQVIRDRRISSYRGLLWTLSGLGPDYSDALRWAVKNRTCLIAYLRSRRYRGKRKAGGNETG